MKRLLNAKSDLDDQSSNSSLFCFVHFALMPLEMIWTDLPRAIDLIAGQTGFSFFKMPTSLEEETLLSK